MRWKVHSERLLYGDQWLKVWAADVELPDGRHLDHRVIRTPPGAGVAAVDEQDRVLLMWRHRFITDTWGWESPIGRIGDGETPEQAAAREFQEETGWRAGALTPLIYTQPSNGLTTSQHHVFRAANATYLGTPAEAFESSRIDWIPLADTQALIRDREIVSGTTLDALLSLLALDA